MPSATLLNRDDPIYDFEHMMAHREYFAIMGSNHPDGLSGFSVLPYILDPSRNTQQPAWDWNQLHQQSHDDFNNDLPDNSNNGVDVTTVTPPNVTGTGNATVTAPATTTDTIILTGLSHSILIGSTIVELGVTVVAQQSGPAGGNGTYTVSPPIPALVNFPLTITHPPYQQATKLMDQGRFGIQQAGILIEGDGQSPENRAWWTFANHHQHLIANDIVLPLPTTAPTTAGTGPGTVTDVSDPWWWEIVDVVFPFW